MCLLLSLKLHYNGSNLGGLIDLTAFLLTIDTSNTTQPFLSQFDSWKNFLQILVVSLLFIGLYLRIRKTYISQLLKGLVGIFLIYIVTRVLDLQILSAILGSILQISVIGILILFQPEIRRFLAYLGRRDYLVRNLFSQSRIKDKSAHLVNELVETAQDLSKSKTGALIVLETDQQLDASSFKDSTIVDAELSRELLTTIFYPKTALHDGAVVIDSNGRIIAAGAILPLSEAGHDKQYGTRHRAAAGLTEKINAMCLVVSEEKGSISLVTRGVIEQIDETEVLRERLRNWFGDKSQSSSNNFSFHFFRWFGTNTR